MPGADAAPFWVGGKICAGRWRRSCPKAKKAEVHAVETDSGLDLAFRWPRKLTPRITADIARLLTGDIARIVFNGEILSELRDPRGRF